MMEAVVSQILLVSDVADRELLQVRNKLGPAPYQVVDGRDSLHALLARMAAHPEPAPAGRRLDLIGHSVAHCFLKLGSWILDAASPAYFKATLKPHLAALQITQVRLLGCSTATTDVSWGVITSIAAGLGDGVEVFGTRRLIDELDYSDRGFISDDALAGYRAVTTPDRNPGPPTIINDVQTLEELARRRIWVEAGPPPALASHWTADHTCYAACAAHRLAAAG